MNPDKSYEVQVRSGVLINDDPQKRCYNGCYFKSHIEWEEWRRFGDYPTMESAEHATKLFARDDQQLRIKP